MSPERAYVGPSWGYVGAISAHPESMLGPRSPILGLCRGHVDPSEVILGLRCVHEFTFIPKFCLEKLSPVACEAPTPLCNTISLKKLNPAWDGHTPDKRLKAPTSGLRGSRKRFPARSPLAKLGLLQRHSPPVTCEFHASSVFAPTNGLRVAQASGRGSAA